MGSSSSESEHAASEEALERWSSALRGATPSTPLWRERARSFAERARSAWPDFAVELDDFFARLGALLAADGERDAGIDQLCIEDLFLAYAASLLDRDALLAFEREVWAELNAALAKLRIPAQDRDDVRQKLW